MLYSMQKICMELQNFNTVKSNVVKYKYNFCIEFEKELDIGQGTLSEEVFDFLYNIFEHKRIFRNNDFKLTLDDFLCLNFLNFKQVMEYINNVYTEMAFLNREYFFQVFKVNHDDPKAVAETFGKNLFENREKFLAIY